MIFGDSESKTLAPLVILASLLGPFVTVTFSAGDQPKGLWLANLERQCFPRESISRELQPGKWLAVDYEVDWGRGVMLYALPHSKAPPLTLKLGESGWHEIRLGIFYSSYHGNPSDRMLTAKLSGDRSYSRFGREFYRRVKDGHYPEKDIGMFDITEVFWKCADLTGQDLIISRPTKGEKAELQSNLTYVRLVPMDEAAVKQHQSEQPTPETKILMANYDSGNLYDWEVTTRADFLNEFECLRDSDFGVALYAMALGPVALYPSKVGEFTRPSGMWGHGGVLRACVENGLNPLDEAIKAAHDCGVKLFPQVRLMGPQLPPRGVRVDFGGKFMADHPEWMATYGDGEPTRHLSFAFKGVRDFYVRLFREWVEDYHADGINVLFSRSYPFVYYEEPVCNAFETEHGEDMRQLPVSNKRVQQTRAQFMTQFLREVRGMLDEVGKKQGRHIPACYTVPVNNTAGFKGAALDECLFHALDIATWIREGLVDYLDVHLHMYGGHDGRKAQPKIREFSELARGTKTKVFVDIYPRRMPPRQYREIAMNYYAAGADGLAFWDSFGRYYRSSEWAFIKRLGHRQDLASWKGRGDDYFQKVPLKRLDGILTGREFSKPSDG